MGRSESWKLAYETTKPAPQTRSGQKIERINEAYEANPKLCKQCGTKIAFDKRANLFCDQSCAASFNNRGKVRNVKRTHACTNCGKATEERHNKYCAECIENRVYNKAASLEEAKDGRARKRIIIAQRGWRCEVCGLSKWMEQPIPIELDHIDGNADNNSEENLRLICPNCHAQTENYKGANMGKGSARQKMRRQRYAEGKTY